MTCILGIDPGSRVTGFGVIEWVRQKAYFRECGCIRLTADSLPERLQEIFLGVTEVIARQQPEILAIEQVFMSHNANSALKLGQARGVAMVAGVLRGVSIFEYAPTQIKQAVTGRGHADKIQVQHMVKVLLNLSASPQADAADALAVALCHAHTAQGSRHLNALKFR